MGSDDARRVTTVTSPSAEVVLRRREILADALHLTALLNAAIRARHEFSSNSEVQALIALRLAGPHRAHELTAVTGMTRAGTTNMIDRLETGGLVQRAPVDTDQRGVLITLTRAGAQAVEEMADRVTHVVTDFAPTIASWGSNFLAMGLDVGRLTLPAGTVEGRLDWVGRFSRTASEFGPLYDEAFGAVVGRHHLLHLLLLATEPGGTHPADVSRETLLSSSSTSDLLQRAEDDGLIDRVSGRPPDRRVTVITVTPLGRAALDIVVDGSGEVMANWAEHFFPA